jgi:hypothetical protein
MGEEKRYTLAEARLILAKNECYAYGHSDLNEVREGGEITMLHCSSCGSVYDLRKPSMQSEPRSGA